jgi:YHS domain-containing protein
MKTTRIVLAVIVMSALVGGYLLGAHAGPSSTGLSSNITCPVTGKPAKADQFAGFNGGKVYFCCGNCVNEFAKDTDKYAAQANLQLMQTGQIKPVACPFSGKPMVAVTAMDVDGSHGTFCCEHCTAKAVEAANAVQDNLSFADANKEPKNLK